MELTDFNRELIFYKQILYLGYFGAAGEMSVGVPVRYNTGSEPEFMKSKDSTCETAISAYWNKGAEDSAIVRLYALLLARGDFKDARKIAARYEYSDALIEKTHTEVVRAIKKSPYRKIIEKLNGIDVEKI